MSEAVHSLPSGAALNAVTRSFGLQSDTPAFGIAARICLGLFFATLICLRMPDIVLHGRFWAEEGQNFYKAADELVWYRALFHPFGGYLNIVANAGTLLAHTITPLEWAPYVTIVISLLFQISPAILVVTSKSPWLRATWATLAALLVVAMPPDSEEVWLQTLHSQFHLAICAGLILAMEAPASRALSAFRLLLLLLGPLSGPAAIMFLPFFFVFAVVEKSTARWLQAGTLAFASALQLGIFYSADPSRTYHLDLVPLACIMFFRHVLLPLFGHSGARIVAASLHLGDGSGKVPWAALAMSMLVFGTWTAIMLRQWRSPPARLMLSAMLVAALSYYGAIDGGHNLLHYGFAIRYSFAPQVLFAISMVACAASNSEPVSRIGRVAVIWIVAIGAHDYFTPSSQNFAHGPDWKLEVSEWRADPHHHLEVWPNGWSLDLPPPHSVDD